MTEPDLGARVLLRMLLGTLGAWLAVSSRLNARFRSQVTRGVVIEISSNDGVARSFVFDGATRTVALSGRSSGLRADCALRFSSAPAALRALTSPQAGRLIMGGLLDGTVRMAGNPALFQWFQGLLSATLPRRAAPHQLPQPYTAPDRSAPPARFITIEPAVDALDPDWHNAVRAREEITMWRVADGAPVPRG